MAENWDLISRESRLEPGWHAARRMHRRSAPATFARRSGRQTARWRCSSRYPPDRFPRAPIFRTASVSNSIWRPSSLGRTDKLRLCLVLKGLSISRDVFGALGDDVVGVVARAPTEALGVKLLLGRLHTWERFVSRFGPDRLSEEQQVGLFAELHFLASEVIPNVTAAAAVRSWRGPFMEAQDFQFKAVAIEVKASSSPDPKSFQVSNLDQLDIGSLDALLIHHVTIEVDAAAGSTLPEMVAKARASLSVTDPAAASDLDASLLEVGYLDIHADYYDRRFRAVDIRWLSVTEGFPCLTRASVPAGIGSVSYAVSLNCCVPYLVSAPSARQIMQARL